MRKTRGHRKTELDGLEMYVAIVELRGFMVMEQAGRIVVCDASDTVDFILNCVDSRTGMELDRKNVDGRGTMIVLGRKVRPIWTARFGGVCERLFWHLPLLTTIKCERFCAGLVVLEQTG